MTGPAGATGPGVFGAILEWGPQFASFTGFNTGPYGGTGGTTGYTSQISQLNPNDAPTGPTGGLFMVPFYNPHVNNAVWFQLQSDIVTGPTGVSTPIFGLTGASGTTAMTGGTAYIPVTRVVWGSFQISSG
jgi:hypothetical protein